MLPMRLNLLPSEKQKNLHRTVLTEFLKNMCELGLLTLVLLGTAFLGGLWVLETHFNELAENMTSLSSASSEKGTTIKEINTLLRRTQKVQKEYTLWTPLVTEIANAIPSGVVLNKLSIEHKTSSITLAGSAATRENLLSLKEQLEQLSFVGTVAIPLSQLTERENIAFAITIPMK